jgi:hypothetical protein
MTREGRLPLPLAGPVMPEQAFANGLVGGRFPLVWALALPELREASDGDVTAARGLRWRAVAGLPRDLDQARPPPVVQTALLRDDGQTNLYHASIQTLSNAEEELRRPFTSVVQRGVQCPSQRPEEDRPHASRPPRA